MLPAVLMLLDWSASEPEVVVYTPIVHYYELEGPSKRRRELIGPDACASVLVGPNKTIRTVAGSV